MSWNLRKTNVSLAVTRFSPDVDRPIAGLTAEQRAEHRARREQECAKVEPALGLYEVRKDFNRYLGNFVELVDARPLPPGPLEPAHICNELNCIECQNNGARQADDGKNRSLWSNGGL